MKYGSKWKVESGKKKPRTDISCQISDFRKRLKDKKQIKQKEKNKGKNKKQKFL